MALAHHIMLRLRDSRVIAPTTRHRRHLARSILRIGEPFGLLAFGVPDTHAHLEALCDRTEAGELARRVEISLTKGLALPVGFAAAYILPVRDQLHLASLFAYCLRQAERHNVSADPYFDATNLPDLLGFRINGSYTLQNQRQFLPRITEEQLLSHLGNLDLTSAPLEPDLRDLHDAAAAAFALDHLRTSKHAAVSARIAAIHAAADRWPLSAIASTLTLSPRSARRLRALTSDPAAVRAVRGQLRLRAALRKRDSPTMCDDMVFVPKTKKGGHLSVTAHA